MLTTKTQPSKRSGNSLTNNYFTTKQVTATFSSKLVVSSDNLHRLFSSNNNHQTEPRGIFANPGLNFESIVQTPILKQRLESLGYSRPTAVQASAFEPLTRVPRSDFIIGAETGSGKTLAYLLPLIDDILQRKSKRDKHDLGYIYARAMILVPNKELVQQVARMALSLSGGPSCLVGGGVSQTVLEALPDEDCNNHERVRIAIMPGGLKEPNDFPPFRNAVVKQEEAIDLLITTPAAVGFLGLSPKNINMFADIATLICDEADMLLDGGYIRPLEQVLLGFRRADKLDDMHQVPKTQHVFVAATLPDFGLRSVDAYLQRKFPNAIPLKLDGMHNARHYGLAQPTVWRQVEAKKERLNEFRDLLDQPATEGGLKTKKIMLFVNSVDDVEGVTTALSESGIAALPYHAKMSLQDRTTNLDRFRKYNSVDDTTTVNEEDAVQILVCTDLASRGVDIPNVNAIVQLQFAGNVVAHLHRMGRCGRAGQRIGRGIVFYGEKESALVEAVQDAEQLQEGMSLKGNDVMEVKLDEDGNDINNKPGTVKHAFSRKRGFTKKRKKQRQQFSKD